VNDLDLADFVALGGIVLDSQLQVRDWGLLESARARPATTVFGEGAYPGLFDKAAALLLSLVTNDPLIDGNKRMGFAATVAFPYKNDRELAYGEDEAYDFVISVADGSVPEVADVAAVLQRWAHPLAH
jgi:death-on-curing protein